MLQTNPKTFLNLLLLPVLIFLAGCGRLFERPAPEKDESFFLKPPIGSDRGFKPDRNIAEPGVYRDPDNSFLSNALKIGESAPDFTLYTPQGDRLNLQTELLQGKMILLVSGSCSSPEFRANAKALDALQADYPNDLIVIVVYTPEAFPVIDESPYYGEVHFKAENKELGIAFRQHWTTYHRQQAALDMINRLGLQAKVVLDNEKNEWWWTYGPAPNRAYLIDSNGRILIRHGWFDPATMARSISGNLFSKTVAGKE